MSGSPSPDGAQALLDLLEKVEPLCAEVTAAREQVAALNKAVVRLKNAETELCRMTRKVGKLLEDMDVASVGNYGFENRMGWLLLEMRRLILAKATCGCTATLNCAQHAHEQRERELKALNAPVPDSMRKD